MRVRTRVIPDGVVPVNTEDEVVHILRWLLDRDVWRGVSRAHTRAHARFVKMRPNRRYICYKCHLSLQLERKVL